MENSGYGGAEYTRLSLSLSEREKKKFIYHDNYPQEFFYDIFVILTCYFNIVI